jgi:transcriptional regulator with XRE-family HTH domain
MPQKCRNSDTNGSEQADAFAFDRRRRTILLVGGDKSKDWKDWYRANIPIADARFEEHQARIAKAEAKKRSAGRVRKRKEETMTLKRWEKKVLEAPGAAGRVAEIEEELRLAAGLTALREEAGFSQRELATRMGISQPRVAAIERARNVTIDVLEQYIEAVGGTLEVNAVKGKSKTSLFTPMRPAARTASRRKPKTSRTARTGRGVAAARRAAG